MRVFFSNTENEESNKCVMNWTGSVENYNFCWEQNVTR